MCSAVVKQQGDNCEVFPDLHDLGPGIYNDFVKRQNSTRHLIPNYNIFAPLISVLAIAPLP